MNKLDGDLAVERLNAAVGSFLDIMTKPEGEMVPVPGREAQPSLAERVKRNLKPSTDEAQQYAQKAEEAAREAREAADNVGSSVKVDVFKVSGTWRKPSGAKLVHIQLCGGGAGGQAGFVGVQPENVNAGDGGGGGATTDILVLASHLTDAMSVEIGAGGAGGKASAGPGSKGANGRETKFGNVSGRVNFSAAGATARTGGYGPHSGGAGGVSGANGNASEGASGGGGGGPISNQTSRYGGGSRGSILMAPAGQIISGTAGGANGGAGMDTGTSPLYSQVFPGIGGGGGGSSINSDGGRGGHGANGGGGGGGGAAWSPHLPGDGGDGGNGYAIITTFL
ncbi:hypothetical protein H9Y13_18740 [Aeromonas veronii]|uniref:glycine-rich domain-containing protein n=1 Tax=Aeromonas TaxID=642 RepID=UPI0022EAD26C|nr:MULTISPECIES: hypothetical protein [Aeromonas]KAJ8740049.1 hypothetical protein H9Y13_18740 [Aeromonas veronii]MDA3317867.1 hypothetical protein [Aeromonas sp. PI_26]